MTAPASSQPALQDGAQESSPDTAPVSFKRFIVALDASDHANRALAEALRLSATAEGEITGIHAYAAALHDRRFRQMEGGLPERYLDEEEMQYQRDVHDDLISQGLGIITDSYHDVAEVECNNADVPFQRLNPEGKNYRRIIDAAEDGDFDVLALGALGLGAVPGSLIGTVCERVVRRSPIDVLVIKDADLAIGDGPIVVAIDGSAKSYGVLRRAFQISRRVDAEIRVVAAYDPYYHYVAFNKIAGVLSEEAGKVFRFREQEQLHEELIDEGIAKIYQSHLDVAMKIAAEEGIEIATKLLDGKAFKVITEYAQGAGASLLMAGMTGVHADKSLDIGGNAENILRQAPCHVWLGQYTFTPPMDVVAEETTSWSTEAEEFLSRAPDFVQGMARKAVIRYAQEKGHTFITRDIVEKVAFQMMPGGISTDQLAEDQAVTWSAEAEALIDKHVEPAMLSGIRLRAEKRARREGSAEVLSEHVTPFIDGGKGDGDFTWAAAAMARLSRVPEGMREAARTRIEAAAAERGTREITLDTVEAGLADSRKAMAAAIDDGKQEKPAFACPFATKAKENQDPATLQWSAKAEARMTKIPEGFMRDMTRQRVEVFARKNGVQTITDELVGEKYAEWGAGSAKQKRAMEWDDDAAARVARIPDFVRGMVELEVERCARELGLERVTAAAVDKAGNAWKGSGEFHSDSKPHLYKEEG